MFRFHLVNDKRISFPDVGRYGLALRNNSGLLTRRLSLDLWKIQSTDNNNNHLCAELNELMENGTNPRGQPLSNSSGNSLNPASYVEIRINPVTVSGVARNSFIRLFEAEGGNALTRLKRIMDQFGLDLKISIEIENFGTYHWISVESLLSPTLMTKEVGILELSGAKGVEAHYSDNWDRSRWTNANFYGAITITCVAFQKTCGDLFDVSGRKPFTVNKMLTEGLDSDATIISSDEEEIKCHKVILKGQSDVFEGMFRRTSKSLESSSGTIHMEDMCSRSVRAFLAFLYLDNLEDARGDSAVALDLLKAAHKYNVPRLETKLKQILLDQPNKWFDVEVAMQLFIFARGIPEGDTLKEKAIAAIKANRLKLGESSSYKQLFREDPDAAMELCGYFVSSGSSP